MRFRKFFSEHHFQNLAWSKTDLFNNLSNQLKMKNFNKIMTAVAAVGLTAGAANAQLSLGEDCGCPALGDRTTVLMSSLTDGSGNFPTGVTTLDCDNIYELDQNTYVPDGGTVNIPAGTIIKGQPGSGFDANSFLVTRGGVLNAVGTPSCPIIFTSTADPLDGTHPITNDAEWGGLIMLGRATNNLLLADGGLAVADGVGSIEGLSTSDSRHYYGVDGGAFIDNDNSGTLKYVSIRHGGTTVGDPDLGNDINGLTLGSVGSGTTLEHIEVLSNFDDGIEFFGGTVDLKYASVLFCGDDYFDYDHGYVGRNQFLFGVMLESPADRGDEGFEADGDDENSDNAPASSPTIFNATLIGNASDRAVLAKEALEGKISNCIFANFAVGVDLADEASRTNDAIDNFNAETLVFSNNCFAGTPTLLTVADAAPSSVVLNQFTGSGNSTDDDVIDFDFTIDPANGNAVSNAYNPVPEAGTASTDELPPIDGFFTAAGYKGAFEPGAQPWTAGYTFSDLVGLDNALVDCPADINGDGFVNNDDFLQFGSAFGTTCGN